ncbi:MAG: hypothetical protein QGG36_21160 [Pirellulaceae bacterium]|jgi:hypothetical protein|nr:hypothetical protein [Pirellulaceae bacterium]MDP7018329.1 hypothetical protein [Pirellulaceae bacterium]
MQTSSRSVLLALLCVCAVGCRVRNVAMPIPAPSPAVPVQADDEEAVAQLEDLQVQFTYNTTGNITEVSFANNMEFKSDDLLPLKKLPYLEAVQFSNSNLDDAGLAIINQCPSVETLHLNGTKVTDEGMQSLMELPHVAYLYIQDTKVSDSMVGALNAYFGPLISIER